VPDRGARILLTGAGDDASLPQLLDDGYSNVVAVNATPELVAAATGMLSSAAAGAGTDTAALELRTQSLRRLHELLPPRSVCAILDCERYHLTTGKDLLQRSEYLAAVADSFRGVLARYGLVVGAWRAPVSLRELRAAFRSGAWRERLVIRRDGNTTASPTAAAAAVTADEGGGGGEGDAGGVYVLQPRLPNPWLSADKHSC
jgi:hypothetical protein